VTIEDGMPRPEAMPSSSAVRTVGSVSNASTMAAACSGLIVRPKFPVNTSAVTATAPAAVVVFPDATVVATAVDAAVVPEAVVAAAVVPEAVVAPAVVPEAVVAAAAVVFPDAAVVPAAVVPPAAVVAEAVVPEAVVPEAVLAAAVVETVVDAAAAVVVAFPEAVVPFVEAVEFAEPVVAAKATHKENRRLRDPMVSTSSP